MTHPDSTTLKKCSKCRVEKPRSEFYADKKKRDGLRFACKDCLETARLKGKPRKFTLIKGHPFLTRVARLFEKIEIDPAVTFKGRPCWLWTGCVNSDGYAQVGHHGRTQSAHRVMYKTFVEDVESTDDQCDHLCRVRRCVNPAHLEIVDNKENQLRGISFSAVNARKTYCVNGHPFDEKNTYYRKSNPTHRDCRECRNISLVKYHLKNFLPMPPSLRKYCKQ